RVIVRIPENARRAWRIQMSDVNSVAARIPDAHDEAKHDRPEDPPPTAGIRINRRALADVEEHFRQPDHADSDQEERPVIRQITPELDVFAEIVQQENDADDHKNQRSGNRSRSHEPTSSLSLRGPEDGGGGGGGGAGAVYIGCTPGVPGGGY